jgi:hypothetical protein
MRSALAIAGLGLSLALALSLAGCGKDSPPSGGAAPAPGSQAAAPGGAAPAGTWSGTWTRTKPFGGGGTMELTLPASGPAAIRETGSLCFSADKDTPATATISGSNVTLAVDAGGIKATYTGTVSGDQMSGTLVVTCAPGTGEGTFTVKKR